MAKVVTGRRWLKYMAAAEGKLCTFIYVPLFFGKECLIFQVNHLGVLVDDPLATSNLILVPTEFKNFICCKSLLLFLNLTGNLRLLPKFYIFNCSFHLQCMHHRFR